MKAVHRTAKFVILDDFFEGPHLDAVWKYMQDEHYTIPHLSGWLKVWRMTDGLTMGGPERSIQAKPFGNCMDLVAGYVEQVAAHFPDLTGEWTDIVLRPYLYGRNVKLSWHNDGDYVAAMTMYVHPYWGSTWGGELMLAETDGGPSSSPHLDHREEDEFLARLGFGTYVTPKPNRCVLTRGDVWHQISRVDADAGDHVRASIVAFFKR